MNKKISSDVAKVVGDIMVLGVKISNETDADVFVNFSGHVNEISVQIHTRGWKDSSHPTLSDSCYLEKTHIKTLRGIRDTLSKFYKNGKVNSENFSYEEQTIRHYKFK